MTPCRKPELEPRLRGTAVGQSDPRYEHLFFQLQPAVAQWNPSDTPTDAAWDNGPSPRFRTWRISTSAAELVRAVAQIATTPLSSTEMDEAFFAFRSPADILAGAVLSGSHVRLACRATLPSGSKGWWMDPGQDLEILAQRIVVYAMIPAPGFRVTPQNAGDTLIGPLVGDANVGVMISEIDSPLVRATCKFTQTIQAPAAGQVDVQVPPYAVDVAITQDGAGGVPVLWERFVGDPAALGVRVGTIDFPAGARSLPRTPIYSTSHLRSNIDAQPRLYSLTWTIRP